MTLGNIATSVMLGGRTEPGPSRRAEGSHEPICTIHPAVSAGTVAGSRRTAAAGGGDAEDAGEAVAMDDDGPGWEWVQADEERRWHEERTEKEVERAYRAAYEEANSERLQGNQ